MPKENLQELRAAYDDHCKELGFNITAAHLGIPDVWLALITNNYTLAKQLLGNTIPENYAPAEGPEKNISTLWMAAAKEQWDIVQTLLQNKPSHINATPTTGEDSGKTVLWLAAAYKQWNIVQTLLNYEAINLDAVSLEGVDKGLTS